MPESAFIIRVPEAEGHVAGLRNRFDASVHLGVPAHITVLVPFMSPERITATILAEIRDVFRPVPAFDFSLSKIARFPATAYLAPEPPDPFIALTEALVQRFPEFPPFRGEHLSVVPHLTVANGNASEAEIAAIELEATMRAHGAIHSRCSSVLLIENSSGCWKEMHAFALHTAHGVGSCNPSQC